MNTIENLSINNYLVTENSEVCVGKDTNKHRVCLHTFSRFDEDGNEKEWFQVVMVYNNSYQVGISTGRQWNENCSAFRAFIGAYKAACEQIGIVPCIEE